MQKLESLNYGIVGLGIMGGSFAKAIRERIFSMALSSGKIFVANRSLAPLVECKKDGVADEIFSLNTKNTANITNITNVASDVNTFNGGLSQKDNINLPVDDMLKICDVVFVCLPPIKTREFLIEHKNNFKSGSIITDISGVKGIYKDKLKELSREDTDFIIAHPMAGGEKEGYCNSNAKFFIDHNYILIPTQYNKKENLELFESLVTALGFSRITYTDIDTHDFKIGYTSQLCHVIASALVESAQDEGITAFGGGSFEDLTRIALINAPLWTELFLENDEKLVAHIEKFEESLDKFKELIKTHDENGLKDLLCDVRQKRSKMGTIRSKR